MLSYCRLVLAFSVYHGLNFRFSARHPSLSGLKRQIMKMMRMKMMRMKMTVKMKNVRVVMIATKTLMKKMILRSLS